MALAKRSQWQQQSPKPLDRDIVIPEIKTYSHVVTIPVTPINFYWQSGEQKVNKQ